MCPNIALALAMVNSVDPDRSVPLGVVLLESTLPAQTYVSKILEYFKFTQYVCMGLLSFKITLI